MSRLDSHIRQKIAQRDSIDLAARWLRELPGVVIELGRGFGRSYAHLLERFPEREVYSFDRRDLSHPPPRPAPDHFFPGEFETALADPALHARFAGRVVLAHLDVGAGGPEDLVLPERLLALVHGWLVPGALVLSDQDLTLDPAWRLERVDTSGLVQHAERYHVYRRRGV